MIEVYYNSWTRRVVIQEDEDLVCLQSEDVQRVKKKLDEVLDMMNFDQEFDGEIK